MKFVGLLTFKVRQMYRFLQNIVQNKQCYCTVTLLWAGARYLALLEYSVYAIVFYSNSRRKGEKRSHRNMSELKPEFLLSSEIFQ